ncbi:MAG: glyoxalase superfamily protein [Pseudomonadota bacterium]
MGIDERPPSRIYRTAAVLQVNSRTVRAMRDFFVDRLGFHVGSEVGNGPSFVTLDRDGQTVMLACKRHFGFRKSGWAAYFWVDDIESLLSEFEARGAIIKGGIVEKEYGCREIVAIAPDGREIVFGESQAADKRN